MLGLRKGACEVGGGRELSPRNLAKRLERRGGLILDLGVQGPFSCLLGFVVSLCRESQHPTFPVPWLQACLMAVAQAQQQGLLVATMLRRPETEPRAQCPRSRVGPQPVRP